MARSLSPDQAGMLASGLCAVHCLAGALLSGAAGFFSFLQDERLELATVVAVTVAGFSMGQGARVHRSAVPGVVAAAAFALLLLARLVEWPLAWAPPALSAVGGVVMVGAHLANFERLRRADACCAAPAG